MERQVLAHPADELADAEDRVLDRVGEHLLAVEPDRHAQVVRVEPGDDPGAHRLEGVRVLPAPEGPVVALPGALAHVVAERVAEDVVERRGLRDALAALADHGHQLALVLDQVARVLGNDDGLVGGHQRVVGAVADVGVRRELGFHAAAVGHLGDVLAVVDARGVEGGRNHRHQQLHPAQDARVRGLGIALPRACRDFGDGGPVDDAVRDISAGLEAAPFHGRYSLRNAPTSRLKTSGRSK